MRTVRKTSVTENVSRRTRIAENMLGFFAYDL